MKVLLMLLGLGAPVQTPTEIIAAPIVSAPVTMPYEATPEQLEAMLKGKN